jgi:hypothetical protein
MFDHVAANASYIDALAKSIEGNPVPMAVVSYVGKHDGDGIVTDGNSAKGEPLSRMYGTRDMRHVAIYKLDALRLNKAAREQKK